VTYYVPIRLLYADGFVIIECEEPGTGHATGQVILDYLTDTVVNKKTTVRGSPLVSPDSRVVVSIDKATDGVTLVVQQVLGRFYFVTNRIPDIRDIRMILLIIYFYFIFSFNKSCTSYL